MKKNKKQVLEEHLGLVFINEENPAQNLEGGIQEKKTLPFSQAMKVLLTETEKGRNLRKKIFTGEINSVEFRKELIKISQEYKHLILV